MGAKRKHPSSWNESPTVKRRSQKSEVDSDFESNSESMNDEKERQAHNSFHMTKQIKPYYDRLLNLSTTQEMKALLQSPCAHSLSWYVRGRVIHVHNKMQTNYSYTLDAEPGKQFHSEFKPQLTPSQMLQLGVFEGKYCNDQIFEYPAEWFLEALRVDKLRPGKADVTVNLFSGYKSRLPLAEWQQRKWIPQCGGDPDVRGWFEWYCRYWLGRRCPAIDLIQIKRWKQFNRHRGQIMKNCTHLSTYHCTCRARQRQALLQWAYDPWVNTHKTQ